MFLWYPLRRWRLAWVPFAVVGLVVIAAPWAEEYWIASRFEELCKDAGVHVVRTVEVDGFYDSTTTGLKTPGVINAPQTIEAYEKSGFRFLERRADWTSDKISHVEKNNDTWVVAILDRPSARYHYKYAYQPTPFRIEEPVGYKLEKTEDQVVDSETGEVLGWDTRYSRYPPVVESLWMARLFGSGRSTCKGPFDQPEKDKRLGAISDYVLIPKKPK